MDEKKFHQRWLAAPHQPGAMLIPAEEEETHTKQSSKDYAPGFLLVAINYLPQMPDEDCREYLFIAIDRAARWVCLEVKPDKSADAAHFKATLRKYCQLSNQTHRKNAWPQRPDSGAE